MTHETHLSPFCVSTAAGIIAIILHGVALSQEDTERYVVPLMTGQITLPSSVPETLPQQVGELVEHRLAQTDAAPATAPLIVIFDGPLDQETREGLAAAGVDILDRLDERSYTVSTSPEGAGRLAELPGVVSATLVPADSKIAEQARRADAAEWERREGARRAYSVLFFEGTPAEEVLALRESELNAELEVFDPRTFPVVRTAIVVIDPEDLPRLAAEPSVQSIEPAPPPDVPDNANNTQPLSNVDDVQLPPYNLSGAGISVGVWEATETATNAFGIRKYHRDLTPRVTLEELLQLVANRPEWSDATGWSDVDNYSTIQTAVVNDELYLLARANGGVHAWKFNAASNSWSRLVANSPEWSDATGWSDVSNYSTIQTAVVNDELYLLARANRGIRTLKLNDG
jgi:hypothetical protein